MSIGQLADELLESVRGEVKTAAAGAEPVVESDPVPATPTGDALRKIAQELRRTGDEITVSELETFIRSGK